ncbi:MAG: hypothetical protein WKF37_21145 [Bryobacteraceae bacterium]
MLWLTDMFKQAPPGVVFAILLLATACLALLYPTPFLRWGGLETKRLVVPLLQVVMFVMGTRVSLNDFAWRGLPRAVAIGLGLQYPIMPLTGAGLAGAGLPPEIGAGEKVSRQAGELVQR